MKQMLSIVYTQDLKAEFCEGLNVFENAWFGNI